MPDEPRQPRPPVEEPRLRPPVEQPPAPGYPAADEEPEPEPVLDDGPWRADRRLTIFKVIGLVVFVVAALLVSDPIGTGLLALAAAVCALYAARDLIMPVRVAADAEGLTLARGYLGRARLPWASVEKVSVDRRTRLGMRSELLEIDAGEHLFLFSSYDLSAEPAHVAAALSRIRTGH
jgi:Bacterial PH domain